MPALELRVLSCSYSSGTFDYSPHVFPLQSTQSNSNRYSNRYSNRVSLSLCASAATGRFVGSNIRLGSRGDSFYEYLLKLHLLQSKKPAYLRSMYDEAMTGVKTRLVRKSQPGGLTYVGELPGGERGGFSPKMDHLVRGWGEGFGWAGDGFGGPATPRCPHLCLSRVYTHVSVAMAGVLPGRDVGPRSHRGAE